ncbi:hypothetical protein BLS_008467 [Venturia inaequalis]|uniref:Uncharacterized protein n=1 Tax=Venturia inaequalis TaxID=5025 RepID=A0A8H3VT75_VENIN|nr:hypothetical protein BLS_008467 [Venturia inaequalis]KAE9976637.1 hypothetical protein EG328_002535 [Venturia inaequalis]KAE9993621.1 hypothetical protein EG327_004142 [Venturia inaequalis]RDI82184.1 hypothetical protein Vi05172_g7767 [Venturia inaequalis]
MASNRISTPWTIEEDVFICLCRAGPFSSRARSGGFKRGTERLNDFLRHNGFSHTRTRNEHRLRYSYRKLKRPHAHQAGGRAYKHSRYNEAQAWISNPSNATMLAIIRAATVA